MRSLGRLLTWPARRLLDPRFRGLAEQIDARHHVLLQEIRASRDEALRLNHERADELARIAARLEALERRPLEQPDVLADALLTVGRVLGLVERRLEELGQPPASPPAPEERAAGLLRESPERLP